MAGKNKQPAGAAPGGGWKRIALVSLLVNAALAAALLWSRAGGSGQGGIEEVSALIDTYFRTWSNADMAGYRDCFHEAASIHFIDADDVPRVQAVEPFVDDQRAVHESKTGPMREVPLRREIDVDGGVARAAVRWRLYKEREEVEGMDYFTLINTKTGWKIVSLVWRSDS